MPFESIAGGFVPVRSPRQSVLRHWPMVLTDGLVAYWTGDEPQARIGVSTPFERPTDSLTSNQRLYTPNFGGKGYCHGRSYITQDISPPLTLCAWVANEQFVTSTGTNQVVAAIATAATDTLYDATIFYRYQILAGYPVSSGRTQLCIRVATPAGASAFVTVPSASSNLIHIVGVFENGSQRLYCDGRFVAEHTLAISATAHQIAVRHSRGWSSGSGTWIWYFPAMTLPSWDLRAYNRALSANEIRTLHDSTRGWFETPKTLIAVPTSYAPAEPLPIRAAPAIRTSKRTEQRPTQFAVNWASPQARALSAVWPLMTDGSNAATGQVSVINGQPKTAPTRLGMTIGFGPTSGTGTTDYFNTKKTDHGYPFRSYSVWVYWDGGSMSGAPGRVFDKRTSGGSEVEALFLTDQGDSSAKVQLSRWYSLAQGTWATNAAPITPSVWIHVVVVMNYETGDPAVIYVNGKSVSVDTLGVPSGTPNTTDEPYIIGNRASDAGRIFKGRMTDLRFYDRYLKALEVESIYTNGWSLYWTPSRTTLHVVPSAYPFVAKRGWSQ